MTRPRLPMMRPRSPGLAWIEERDVVAALVRVDEHAVGVVDEMAGDVLDHGLGAGAGDPVALAADLVVERRPRRLVFEIVVVVVEVVVVVVEVAHSASAASSAGASSVSLAARPLRRRALRQPAPRRSLRARAFDDLLRLGVFAFGLTAASLPFASLYASHTPGDLEQLADLSVGCAPTLQPVQRALVVDLHDRRLLRGARTGRGSR